MKPNLILKKWAMQLLLPGRVTCVQHVGLDVSKITNDMPTFYYVPEPYMKHDYPVLEKFFGGTLICLHAVSFQSKQLKQKRKSRLKPWFYYGETHHFWKYTSFLPLEEIHTTVVSRASIQ